MNLGLREEVSYQQTILQLEKSYNKHFANKLKIRIQQEYPHMKTLEYRWKLIELKRYFIMASLLKQVPMFSDEVDDLWHEMLMFTKSYADFCAELMGSTVHHGKQSPAAKRQEHVHGLTGCTVNYLSSPPTVLQSGVIFSLTHYPVMYRS